MWDHKPVVLLPGGQVEFYNVLCRCLWLLGGVHMRYLVAIKSACANKTCDLLFHSD